MRITELKRIGKSIKYKIFIDNVFWCILIDETIVKYNLKKDTDYNAEFLNNVKSEGEKKVALNLALKLISFSSKTTKEIQDYLHKKSFSSKTADFVIEKLQSYNYINDETYTKNYINIKKESKGRKAIEFALKNKGISSDIIKKNIDNLIVNQDDLILKIVEKFIKNKVSKIFDNGSNLKNMENDFNMENGNYKKYNIDNFFQLNAMNKKEKYILRNKLFNHLSMKGFVHEEIIDVINKIFQ